MAYKPLVLIILDGYGVNIKAPQTTWRYAQRPTFEHLEKFYPFTTLQASGTAVGLPWGEEGNSEVGHLTIGAGRVIYSYLPRIIVAIQDGSFFNNSAFQKAVTHIKKNKSRLHAMGLFSSGSVHAYVDHVYALLDFAAKNHLKEFYLHLFTDGRDAPPQEAAKFFSDLEMRLEKQYPFAHIASVIGRHFAMDRDEHWDFIERTYNLLTEGKGGFYQHASQYIESAYKENATDEFIEPGFLSFEGEKKNKPLGRIKDGDALIFFNYREDSARELTSAFVIPGFDKFPRQKIQNLFFASMTQYDEKLPTEVAFSPLDIRYPLARVISDAGLSQLHIAETEKYAHVTYFFNGGQEKPFPGEDRILIPSPSSPHFDEVPEMSAPQITDRVIEALDRYDFILANFANADMVGHTGNFKATTEALEVLDFSIGKIIPKVLERNGVMIITADHGNAEEKLYQQTGEIRTKHSTNPVPVFIVGRDFERSREYLPETIVKTYRETRGMLADIAPTILELIGLSQPREMNGVSLISKLKDEDKEV